MDEKKPDPEFQANLVQGLIEMARWFGGALGMLRDSTEERVRKEQVVVGMAVLVVYKNGDVDQINNFSTPFEPAAVGRAMQVVYTQMREEQEKAKGTEDEEAKAAPTKPVLH
jgi:hypothetical protein